MPFPDDLTDLLVPDVEGKGLTFSQATLVAWDAETFDNILNWRGESLHNVPIIAGVDALSFRVGDTLGLLIFSPEGGSATVWILGRVSVPPLQDPVDVVGGDIIITDGRLIVRDTNGDIAVQISRTSLGGGVIATYHPNGTPHIAIGSIVSDTGENVGQGMVVQDQNGNDIFNAFPSSVTGINQFRVFDINNQQQVVSSDKEGGGLDRPYLDVPMYNQLESGQPLTTLTDVSMWRGRIYVTHRYLHAQIRAGVTAAATTGTIRVFIDGVQRGSTVNVNSTTNAFFDFGGVFSVQNTIPINNFAEITLVVSRTGGAGSVRCWPYGISKRGSP